MPFEASYDYDFISAKMVITGVINAVLLSNNPSRPELTRNFNEPDRTDRSARIHGSTLVKLIVLGSTTGFTLFTTALGIAALFGAHTVDINSHYVTGIKALFIGPFLGLFMGISLGLLCAFSTYIGLRSWALFRSIRVKYIVLAKPDDDHSEPPAK